MRSYSTQPDREVWDEWKDLVNLKHEELAAFRRHSCGEAAGLSKADAKQKGIESGQRSAEWLLRMIPTGKSYVSAERNWTPKMWSWARRQIAFIRRHRAQMESTGEELYTETADGRLKPKRRMLALLIWGHDPDRYDFGKQTPLMKDILWMTSQN